ncbi:MAG: histidine kinase, partial [Candidatus Promineifilaceae bacterium]
MFRWRNLILLFVPLTILVPVLVFAGVSLYQQTLRDVVQDRDTQTARTAAAAISEQLTRRAEIIQGIADQATVSDDYILLLESISFLESEFDAGIVIWAVSGEWLGGRGVLPNEASAWPIVAASSANPFSDVFIDSRNSELALLTMAVNESVIVAGAFYPTRLANQVLFNALDSDSDGDISAFIVDENGERICSIGVQDSAELALQQQYCITEALAGNSGSIYPTDGNTERVIAFSPIEPVGWALVTEEPLAATVNPRLNALLIAPLMLVPIVLVTLGLIWFGDRQVLRPLELLEQKAAALGRGEFESIEGDVGGIDAVQRLQVELVQMSRKVDQAQRNLRTQVGAITLGQEEERRRLARELHDDTIQSLIALNQQVQLAQLRADSNGAAAVELHNLQSMISDLIGDVRRFTHALRPVGLEDLGLVPALELLVENSRSGQDVAILLLPQGTPHRLPMTQEFTLYRIAQEAINNALRHASAGE